MAKRINISRLKSKLRQSQSKQRQAVSRYNKGVRKYNKGVRDLKAAVGRYSQEVRTYNARRRLNAHRLRAELEKLERSRSTEYTHFRTSVTRLQTTFGQLEQSAASRTLSPSENFFLDLVENETANSVTVANALLSDDDTDEQPEDLQNTVIIDEVAVISEELDERWRGALFSLHPSNPEASRHFCSSAREIFHEILEVTAPDQAVFAAIPDCPVTDLGNATRRSRMAYLLAKKGVRLPEAADFANDDIENVLELFDLLNMGTHGAAGRFQLLALLAIKRRVEDGLIFLSRLAA